MKQWSEYREDTGEFTGRTLSGSDADLEINTRSGYAWKSGSFDHLSQRVDVSTSDVTDYQPPQPDDDHEWNTQAKRWIKRPAAAARDAKRATALAEIRRLETEVQPRVQREIDLGYDGALQRLIELDQKIQELRAHL